MSRPRPAAPDAPLRVLFVVRALTVGGAERQLVLLAIALQRRGHDITICTAYPGGALAAELQGSGVRHVELGQRSRVDYPRMVWQLRRAIGRVRPEIVHGYLPTSNTLAALATPHRTAAIVWGVRASDMHLPSYGRSHQIAFAMTRWLASWPDLIIANSEAGARFHVQNGYPEPIMVIPNGIDTDRFHPDSGVRAERRSAWGVPPGIIVIGMVARLDPMKDHVALIDAVALLHARQRQFKIVCIGEGTSEYTAMLKARAAAVGVESVIEWYPPAGDAPKLYPAFDIAVSCSCFGEGFSNALGEAMACGVPCVTTDVGDARRIVGDTGTVVPSRSPAALADALDAMMSSDRTALGLRARQRIVDEFNLERLISRTVDALTAVRSRHRQGLP